MSFSHRRENDEKSRRDYRLGLSCFCWGAYTHGSRHVFAYRKGYASHGGTRRAGSMCVWEARARRRKARAA